RVGHHRAGAVGAPPVEDLPGDLAPHLDALTGPAGGEARQVGGEGRVEGARLGGEQGGQRVVGRLGRRRLGRGAARGSDVGVVGRERPVDGDDRVVDGRLRDRQGAGG